MLSDFLSLESVFGRNAATMFLDEIIEKYGEKNLQKSLSKGYLENRTIYIGPDSGRVLCWLSEKGRQAIIKSLIPNNLTYIYCWC